jgi:hypothetical protein
MKLKTKLYSFVFNLVVAPLGIYGCGDDTEYQNQRTQFPKPTDDQNGLVDSFDESSMDTEDLQHATSASVEGILRAMLVEPNDGSAYYEYLLDTGSEFIKLNSTPELPTDHSLDGRFAEVEGDEITVRPESESESELNLAKAAKPFAPISAWIRPARGNYKIAYIRVNVGSLNVKSSDERIRTAVANATAAIQQSSGGVLNWSLLGSIGSISVPADLTQCKYWEWLTAARQEAQRQALASDVKIVAIVPMVRSCSFSGMSGNPLLAIEADPGVIAHELGHGFGLGHAATLLGNAVSEYGDSSDVMGRGPAGRLNVPHSYALGWVAKEDLHQANVSGLYTIALSETQNAETDDARILRVAFNKEDNAHDDYFLVSYRGLESTTPRVEVHQGGSAFGSFYGISTTLLAWVASEGSPYVNTQKGLKIEVVSRTSRSVSIRVTLPAATLATWTNPLNPLDVNGDKVVSTADALIVQNDLKSNGARQLPNPEGIATEYLDTNGDGWLTPNDVLRIINQLNTK